MAYGSPRSSISSKQSLACKKRNEQLEKAWKKRWRLGNLAERDREREIE